MNNFLILPELQRRNVFSAIAHKVGLPAQIVEKDFWVTAVLNILFHSPLSEHLVFKGGTSLSKGWKLIERFSEDVDLAVNPLVFGITEGDLSKKQIKKLRKASSLFVLEELSPMLNNEFLNLGLNSFISCEAQPNGLGDNTYPEPRRIYIHYKSVFINTINYIRPDIVLEISARSLLEPAEPIAIKSIIAEHITISPLFCTLINTAIPAKTFLEKAFLLHELFSTPNQKINAERKSRHLYDLFVMMNKDFAKSAICDNQLWESIRHHREVFTSVHDVDYTPDVRSRIQLVPGEEFINLWKKDYDDMRESMIYGEKPTFEELIAGMQQLQNRFRNSL